MSTPNPPEEGREPDAQGPEPIKASKGFESSDVRVSGVVVFLTSLAVFVAVVGALSYGIGGAINAHLAKGYTQDYGRRGKWAATVDVRPLGNLANSPELQNKLAELTQRFPTPRLQTDDGNQDVADLHAREDLLLDYYSWADRSESKVRIPIDRAMELIVQRGLPVAPAVERAKPMTGEAEPAISAPLTSGFARTGYELDQAQAQKAEAGRR